MKILFSTYSVAFQNPGGGENVILRLKDALEGLGCTVDLFDPVECDPADYDLIHHFSLFGTEVLCQFRKLRPGIPLVLTPTAHVLRGFLSRARWRLHLLGERLQNKAAGLPTGALELPDLWLAATAAEAGLLREYFGIGPARIRVLPNGVDPEFARATPDIFRARSGITAPFVLHVGRFHPVKNQEVLLRACALRRLTAVFVGGADAGYRGYRESCERLARELERADPSGATRFHFFGHEPFGSELLRSAYAAAGVFALPSEFETFGISALEAMAAGCTLVLSANVAERSLFPGARFVPPQAVAQWGDALVEALASRAEAEPGARRLLLEKLSWPAIGRDLLAHYAAAQSSAKRV